VTRPGWFGRLPSCRSSRSPPSRPAPARRCRSSASSRQVSGWHLLPGTVEAQTAGSYARQAAAIASRIRSEDPDGLLPLAKAYSLSAGKVRAVDHEGREFDVTVEIRGPGQPAVVTVARGGQSLTAQATGRRDPTLTARHLAGRIAGEREPGRGRARGPARPVGVRATEQAADPGAGR